MKYIITDKNEVKIGDGYHADLAEKCEGKVIRAGHCKKLGYNKALDDLKPIISNLLK